jgi:LysR family glycine cleavage system transcriptional activator
MRRLAHLNALRAFEAAARHCSFVLGAEELSVTPAAVSQQIKTLEEYLGIALFRRVAKGVVLTDIARAMLPDVRQGFDMLAAGVARAAAATGRSTLVVSLTASVAAKWLMPRLERFTSRHPAIEVRLDTTTRLVEFSREQVDIALRYGAGRWPGLVVTPLMSEEVFPVCSPKLLSGRKALRRMADLRRHTLIHDASMPAASAFPQWSTWLEAAGVSGVDLQRGLHLNASMLVIQAAIEGHGVALGRSVLVADDLATGRLVRPFAIRVPLQFGYFIVHPRKPVQAKAVEAFGNWLKTEAVQPIANSGVGD